MKSASKNVLIVDDHPMVRAGYRQFLRNLGIVLNVAEAASAAEAGSKLETGHFDALLLDIALQDRTGLAFLKEIRSKYPNVHVLIVSGLPEEQFAIEALRAGAHGFLPKHTAAQELVEAVRKLLAGQRYVSAALAQQMVDEVGQPRGPRHDLLSEREWQVFERLVTGATVTAIANELGLSIKTISTYRVRILEKMRLKGTSDMTSYAYRHRLFPAESKPPEPKLLRPASVPSHETPAT